MLILNREKLHLIQREKRGLTWHTCGTKYSKLTYSSKVGELSPIQVYVFTQNETEQD